MYTTMVLAALCRMIYLALHVTGSSSFPKPLSREEEEECLARIEQGDVEAKNKLIEHNLRLVAHIIKKYYASYRDQEDLISIGRPDRRGQGRQLDHPDGYCAGG